MLVADQPPMRNTLPPHFGQVPEIAGFPFFIVMFCGFTISTFILSLTQYAWAIGSSSINVRVTGTHVPHPLSWA